MLPGFTTNLGARLLTGGGGNLGNVPASPINILVAGNESVPYGTNLGTKLVDLSSALGWPTVTYTNVTTPGDFVTTYSAAAWDVVIGWTDYGPGANTYATINNFLAAGKGVIFLMFGHDGGYTFSSFTNGLTDVLISSSGGSVFFSSAQTVTDSTNHPILYQVTGVAANQLYANNGFLPQNSATLLGTWSGGYKAVMYKNPNVGFSRRVDINMWPGGNWAQLAGDGNTQAVRILLNACFWSARKTG